MSAYLEAHLPHLTSLHTQLALGPDALASDQARIEAAIKTAVEELLRERETQVDEYKEVIAAQKRRMSNLARALGDKGRNVVDVHRRESMENETLPRQLDRLIKQSEDLESVYEERIKHIESQQTILTHLAALLGPPIEAPAPLARLPAARSSLSLVAPGPLGRVVSVTGPANSSTVSGTAVRQSTGAAQESTEEQERNELYDVAEHITVELDEKVEVALAERDARVDQMESLFDTLATFHTELGLPPVPISQPHHFPLHLLPTRATEETPGANAAHEKLLARMIPDFKARAEQDSEEEGKRVEGLKGVEPELGLLGWLNGVRELWEQEQTSREARIQALYDQIEPLWGRLQVDEDQMTLFLEINIGCGEAAIRAYEAELERCLELRRSSLSSFILGARAEIEQLWSDLMLSEDETSAFGAFIDDRYTEELLAEHEAYAEQLRAEITSKAALLPRVREWHALVLEEEELERLQNDPDRFKRRGGAMLKEEKSRKRVMVLKPKIEEEMLTMIPVWEEANGRPFVVQGERVVDKIHEALEAKEAAKEAKKRARQGLGPPPSTATQSRALQPAKTVRGTPAPSARSAQSTNKRAAPTPTPSVFGTSAAMKRTRTGPPPSTVNSVSASARSISGSAIPGLSGTGYRAAQARAQGQGPAVRAASATALQGHGMGTGTSRVGMGMGMGIGEGIDLSTPCPQPRPAGQALSYGHLRQAAPPPPPVYNAPGLQSRIPSNSSTHSTIPATAHTRSTEPVVSAPTYTYTQPALSTAGTSTTTISVLPPVSSLTSLAKANGRRPKRESFKPRQSLMRRMSMIRAEVPPFECLEEDGEEEGDVGVGMGLGMGGMGAGVDEGGPAGGFAGGVEEGRWCGSGDEYGVHETKDGLGLGLGAGLGQVREEVSVFE